jgi:hypothetical protein
VKFQAASLSIDDEDFKDNLYMTYEVVAKSMINTHFANMQGSDIMKLSDEERDILMKTGLKFPQDDQGNPTNELEVIWNNARATFDFEVEAEQDKAKDDEKRLEGLLKVAELRKTDPNFDAAMQQDGKRMNVGELYSEIVTLTTDNDKIIEDIDPADLQNQMAHAGQVDPNAGVPPQAQAQPQPPVMQGAMDGQNGMDPHDQPQPGDVQPDPESQQALANVQAVMQQYGVDQETAAFALHMEATGQHAPEDVKLFLQRQGGLVHA